MYNRCNNQINKIKEFEANLNILKRQALIEFGHMLPFLKIRMVFNRNKSPYLLSYLVSILKTPTIQTNECGFT